MPSALRLSWFAVLLIPAIVQADVASGPSVGAEIKPLKVEAVTGDQAGKELDFAQERGDKPTIFVFVNAARFDRPAGRFLKRLDDAVKAHSGKVSIVAVWLTDDKDAGKTRLTAIQNSLQFGATSLTVYPSLKDLPDGWGLNTDAAVTAVVVAGKKVAANFAYFSVNDTVVPEVAAELSKAVK